VESGASRAPTESGASVRVSGACGGRGVGVSAMRAELSSIGSLSRVAVAASGHLPISDDSARLPPRSNCSKHGALVVKLPWAEPSSRFTILSKRLAIELRGAASQKAIADIEVRP